MTLASCACFWCLLIESAQMKLQVIDSALNFASILAAIRCNTVDWDNQGQGKINNMFLIKLCAL